MPYIAPTETETEEEQGQEQQTNETVIGGSGGLITGGQAGTSGGPMQGGQPAKSVGTASQIYGQANREAGERMAGQVQQKVRSEAEEAETTLKPVQEEFTKAIGGRDRESFGRLASAIRSGRVDDNTVSQYQDFMQRSKGPESITELEGFGTAQKEAEEAGQVAKQAETAYGQSQLLDAGRARTAGEKRLDAMLLQQSSQGQQALREAREQAQAAQGAVEKASMQQAVDPITAQQTALAKLLEEQGASIANRIAEQQKRAQQDKSRQLESAQNLARSAAEGNSAAQRQFAQQVGLEGFTPEMISAFELDPSKYVRDTSLAGAYEGVDPRLIAQQNALNLLSPETIPAIEAAAVPKGSGVTFDSKMLKDTLGERYDNLLKTNTKEVTSQNQQRAQAFDTVSTGLTNLDPNVLSQFRLPADVVQVASKTDLNLSKYLKKGKKLSTGDVIDQKEQGMFDMLANVLGLPSSFEAVGKDPAYEFDYDAFEKDFGKYQSQLAKKPQVEVPNMPTSTTGALNIGRSAQPGAAVELTPEQLAAQESENERMRQEILKNMSTTGALNIGL